MFEPTVQSRVRLSILVVLFMCAIIIPIRLYLGPILLMPYRMALLIALIPCVLGLINGKAGRVIFPDVMVILFWAWAGIAILGHHGFGSWEGVVMHFVETVVPYLLARVYVRDEEQFRIVVRILFKLVLVLLPFAIFESLTTRPILLEIMQKFVSVPYNITMEPRLGLDRAQVIFEHPILFGMFSASSVALSFYVIRFSEPIKRGLRYIPTGLAAVICSVSTGALLSFSIQFVCIVWDHQKFIRRHRWRLFIGTIILAYVSVDLLSNRTPFQVFISYMTLNSGTGGMRLLIFDYGIAEVWRHPVFGIGFNDWIRPEWMHADSVDNFWLLNAMRYGIPGLVLLVLAIISIIRRLSKVKGLSKERERCRNGYLIALSSLMVGMCTVHLWGPIYPWFMFLLGSAVWLYVPPKPVRSGISQFGESNEPLASPQMQ